MGVYTGTPPTFLTGELPDSDKYDEISDFMTAATSAWTSWTPTWTSSGTAVALGNGTLAGKYTRLGKLIFWRIKFVVGSTSTIGTGNYFFSLPVNTIADIPPDIPCGAGYLLDTSTQNRYRVVATASTVDKIWLNVGDNNPGVWQAGAPFAVAQGDGFSAGGAYEAA